MQHTAAVLVLLSLATLASSLCYDRNTNCAQFARANFCTNTFYSREERRANCAQTCQMCDGPFAPALPMCEDNHKNCANFAKNGYCTNPIYSAAAREETCARTCGFCPPLL